MLAGCYSDVTEMSICCHVVGLLNANKTEINCRNLKNPDTKSFTDAVTRLMQFHTQQQAGIRYTATIM